MHSPPSNLHILSFFHFPKHQCHDFQWKQSKEILHLILRSLVLQNLWDCCGSQGLFKDSGTTSVDAKKNQQKKESAKKCKNKKIKINLKKKKNAHI